MIVELFWYVDHSYLFAIRSSMIVERFLYIDHSYSPTEADRLYNCFGLLVIHICCQK